MSKALAVEYEYLKKVLDSLTSKTKEWKKLSTVSVMYEAQIETSPARKGRVTVAFSRPIILEHGDEVITTVYFAHLGESNDIEGSIKMEDYEKYISLMSEKEREETQKRANQTLEVFNEIIK